MKRCPYASLQRWTSEHFVCICSNSFQNKSIETWPASVRSPYLQMFWVKEASVVTPGFTCGLVVLVKVLVPQQNNPDCRNAPHLSLAFALLGLELLKPDGRRASCWWGRVGGACRWCVVCGVGHTVHLSAVTRLLLLLWSSVWCSLLHLSNEGRRVDSREHTDSLRGWGKDLLWTLLLWVLVLVWVHRSRSICRITDPPVLRVLGFDS